MDEPGGHVARGEPGGGGGDQVEQPERILASSSPVAFSP